MIPVLPCMELHHRHTSISQAVQYWASTETTFTVVRYSGFKPLAWLCGVRPMFIFKTEDFEFKSFMYSGTRLLIEVNQTLDVKWTTLVLWQYQSQFLAPCCWNGTRTTDVPGSLNLRMLECLTLYTCGGTINQRICELGCDWMEAVTHRRLNNSWTFMTLLRIWRKT